MLNQISEMLKKYANGWLVLVFLAGEMLFNAVILPNQLAKIEAASGGIGPIDMQLFYTPEKVYPMVASYGDAGRADYRLFELTGDIIFPIIYTLLFALLVTWLFQRGFAKGSRMQRMNVVPLGGWLFDLLENLGIVSMLSIYPATPAVLAWITALFTLVKWLFAGATIVLVLIGFVMALRNGFKKQEALSPSTWLSQDEKPFNANDTNETNNANFSLFAKFARFAPFALRPRLQIRNLSSLLEKTISPSKT